MRSVLALSAKVKVPLWPVDASLQTLALFTIAAAFGRRLAVATVALYLLEGALGLPVFQGTPERGIGLAYMAGPTGGYLVGVYKLGFNPAAYLKNTMDFLEFMDVFSGLVKASVFGFIIALMGCYNGYYSKGGAQGVGAATTNAVVSASILILTSNYLITELFFGS